MAGVLVFAASAMAQCPPVQTSRFIASDGQANDQFGSAVAIDGDTAIVGAELDDDRGPDAGSAYVFERVGGVWTQAAKLLPSDSETGKHFGHCVSISGDFAIVGAQGDDELGVDAGSAYIFENNSGVWTQVAKLLASDGEAGDYFGQSVSIDNNTALVGAMFDNDLGSHSGSVYVFERVNGVWTQVDKLVASDGVTGDEFGASVAVDGDNAVIGAHNGDDLGGRAGSAYVFVRVEGAWTQSAKLLASEGAAGDSFGSAVSMDGDTIVIGAWHDDDLGSNCGSAWVFERSGGAWTQAAKLLASDGAADDNFGFSVAISGSRAVVGAHGHDDLGSYSGAAYDYEKVGGT